MKQQTIRWPSKWNFCRYPYSSIVTFGGCQDDFMLVVSAEEGAGSQKLLFALSKPKVKI